MTSGKEPPEVEEVPSLLGGRRTRPLVENEVRTVVNTFYGLSRDVDVRYDPTRPTGFRLIDEDGEEKPVITFSADIFPGPNIVNPNSALSMRAAVAHELSHYQRWIDNLELPWGHYPDLDEALTSLDALMRYGRDQLTPHEMEQLAADATHRLQLHRSQLPDADADPDTSEATEDPDDGSED